MVEAALQQDNSAGDAADLEKLAEALGEQVVALKAEIAALTTQVDELKGTPPAEAPTPIVNVAPSAAAVNVQASEVNPTFAPNITVPAAQVIASPEINLKADQLAVSLQVNELVAAIQASAELTAGGLKSQAGSISQIAGALTTLAGAFVQLADKLGEQADQAASQSNEQVNAIETMARALLAPRSLVLDADGQPTGIVVDRKLQ